MIQIINEELTFAFPEVHERARISMHFRICAGDGNALPIICQNQNDEFLVSSKHPLELHFRPANFYPFAVIVMVDGINAMSGDGTAVLSRVPLSFFVTPPQGAIDAFQFRDEARPIKATKKTFSNRTGLSLQVYPMKRKQYDFFAMQRRLIPGPERIGPHIREGMERTCEPIYEDLSSLGDWDRYNGERCMIWLELPTVGD